MASPHLVLGGGGSNIKGGNFDKMGDTEGIILGKYGD